jgi:antibiotic biosynthesis monooxygenase (ABM) superfamily enzyme
MKNHSAFTVSAAGCICSPALSDFLSREIIATAQHNRSVLAKSKMETLLYWLAALFVVADPAFAATQIDSQTDQAQFSQEGPKLVGTGGVGLGEQGWSVALSADGNTAIVGGLADNRIIGAAWVFTRSNGNWTQQGGKLAGTGAAGSAAQGYSVALSGDGNTVIVGGPFDDRNSGAAWVYTRSDSVWSQQGNKLVGTGAVGSAKQGVSVALSNDGNTAIVGGAADNDYTGAAWVFTRNNGVWSQLGAKLTGTGAAGNAGQGYSVALSGDGKIALVGGPFDKANAGAAWVYTRRNGIFSQQGNKLVGDDAAGEGGQGYSVALSIDGNTAIIGAPFDNIRKGAAWIYRCRGTHWTQQGNKLVGENAIGSARQGASVALSSDGTTAIVGGVEDSSYRGAAWVFSLKGGVWTQQNDKLTAKGASNNAMQGHSVALSADGKTAIVGGLADDKVTGAAWVFTRNPQLLAFAETDPPTYRSISAQDGYCDR